MGGDLSAAAVQLGKALNDPVANLGELGRAGIQFSKEQKLVIKSLFEGGDAAGAQAMILEELTRQFGGSAEAAAKAAGGGIKQFTNALGDAQEVLGEQLLPTLDEFGRKGVVILAHTAEAVALLRVGLIALSVAANRPAIAFLKFRLVLAKLSAFALGPWSAAQDKIVADLDLQIAQWEILAGGGVLRAREAYEDYLDAATKAGAASKALADALGGSGPNSVAGGAAKAVKAITALGSKLFVPPDKIGNIWFPPGTVDEIVKRAAAGHAEAARKLAAQAHFMPPDRIGLLWFPPGTVDAMVREAESQNAGEKVGETFGEDFSRVTAQLLVLAITDQDWESIGAGIGSLIGQSLGGTGAIGGAVGGLFGKIAEGNKGTTGPSAFEQELNRLSDSLTAFIRSSIPSLVAQLRDLFDEISEQMMGLQLAGQDLGPAFDAARQKICRGRRYVFSEFNENLLLER